MKTILHKIIFCLKNIAKKISSFSLPSFKGKNVVHIKLWKKDIRIEVHKFKSFIMIFIIIIFLIIISIFVIKKYFPNTVENTKDTITDCIKDKKIEVTNKTNKTETNTGKNKDKLKINSYDSDMPITNTDWLYDTDHKEEDIILVTVSISNLKELKMNPTHAIKYQVTSKDIKELYFIGNTITEGLIDKDGTQYDFIRKVTDLNSNTYTAEIKKH